MVGPLGEALDRSKERPSATFVTLEGDIVRGPLVIGGKSENATPGVFSLKRQLSDLEALLGTEETRASGIAAELQTIEEDLRAADGARLLGAAPATDASWPRSERGPRSRSCVNGAAIASARIRSWIVSSAISRWRRKSR